MKDIYVAPMQGFTDAAFRHFHADVYLHAPVYFTPFMRVEKKEIRAKDMRELASPLNANHRLVPQIIFGNMDEFEMLVNGVVERGYDCVDLNLGCPFVLQVKRGRGVAALLNRELMKEVASAVGNYSNLRFSAKIRPGMNCPDEWKGTFDILDSMPLSHITVHSRIGRQEYEGEPDMVAFAEILSASSHPVIFNGGLNTPEDMQRIADEFPAIQGLMVGQGILSRPSIVEEYCSGKEMNRDERMERIMLLHDGIFGYYREVLCGDAQILSKIKPFWTYLEAEIGHKAYKTIRKAVTVQKYLSALNSIGL